MLQEKNLGQLLLEGENSTKDVKLNCEGTEFKVHKCVLMARSPVFQAMFEADMKEKQKMEVDIEDFPKTAVLDMIRFIYLGKLENVVNSEALFKLAGKYQIKELQDLCCKKFIETVTRENVIERGILGDIHSSEELVIYCGYFINKEQIELDDETRRRLMRFPTFAMEIMKKRTSIPGSLSKLDGLKEMCRINVGKASSKKFCSKCQVGGGPADVSSCLDFTMKKDSLLCGVRIEKVPCPVMIVMKIFERTGNRLIHEESFLASPELSLDSLAFIFEHPLLLKSSREESKTYLVKATFHCVGWGVKKPLKSGEVSSVSVLGLSNVTDHWRGKCGVILKSHIFSSLFFKDVEDES